MTRTFTDVSSLDKTVHEPARLAILTSLSACQSADFAFLQSLTGLTVGNLSAHLTKLEQAGFVTIEKRARGRYPQTFVSLTPDGAEAIRLHWKRLEDLRRTARARRPGVSRRNLPALTGA